MAGETNSLEALDGRGLSFMGPEVLHKLSLAVRHFVVYQELPHPEVIDWTEDYPIEEALGAHFLAATGVTNVQGVNKTPEEKILWEREFILLMTGKDSLGTKKLAA
jgi:hypothetical protein